MANHSSVWRTVSSLAAAVEVPTLRRVIGEGLVSKCEELDAELAHLREILQSTDGFTLPGQGRMVLERKIALLLEELGTNFVERENESRLRAYVKERPQRPSSQDMLEVSRWLNVEDIDMVVEDVRRLLEADARRMEAEIDVLVEGKAPPSLLELRQFGSRLQDEWLRQEKRPEPPRSTPGAGGNHQRPLSKLRSRLRDAVSS